MKNQRLLTFACSTLLLGSVVASPAWADGHEMSDKQNEVAVDATDKASDAWREGKLDTVFLFNRHLNNFSIDPEVRGTQVTLIGKVESEVDKELAEQLSLGVDGIKSVENKLVVVSSDEARKDASKHDRDFSDRVEDATLTAEVKMKLLASGETGGLAINVDTEQRAVTLTGEVDSSAERDLAIQIAKNVEGVTKVHSKLKVKES